MPNDPSYIVEPQRTTPVAGDYDVVVVGGGIAGVAAAVAAARNDARTCLIEKENALGGLATLGLVVIYLPLCDGRGNQVIAGLGEELLKLSLKYGPGSIPECWTEDLPPARRKKKRYRVRFNPASFLLALEEFVLDNGVSLIYDSRYCAVKTGAAGEIESVIIENKSGRTAINCGVVVDASGDADVASDAGEPTVSLDTNRRSGWFYSCDGKENTLHQLHDPLYSDLPAGIRTFAGDNWRDVTQMNIASRKLILKALKDENAFESGKYPLLVPVIPQLRMTRRISAGFELDEDHSHTMFPDAVGLTGDWRRSGPVFSIPYRCLRGEKTPNLLTAGRCISVTDRMWDITRAIPACAVTGQAAGAAAALAVEGETGVREIDISRMQNRLKKQDVILDMP